MKANGNEITWKTDIKADILDSSKYILTEFKSVPGQLCDKIINRLDSKIETLHSLSDGNDSLMATAVLIDKEPKRKKKAKTTVSGYEGDNKTFKSLIFQMDLDIVKREIDELKEVIACCEQKMEKIYDDGSNSDDPDYIACKNKINEAESRLSKATSLYCSLSGLSEPYYPSKLAEAKARRAADPNYKVPRKDYNELVGRNWYVALRTITGKDPEELGVDSRDKAIFDSALDCFKKHFEGKNPIPAEMQSYWDKLKSGTSEDFHFGDDERDRIYKVSNIISGLDDVMNGYSFKISIWAKCNGMSVDEEYFDDFIDQEKVNAPGYYKVALDKIKFNK